MFIFNELNQKPETRNITFEMKNINKKLNFKSKVIRSVRNR